MYQFVAAARGPVEQTTGSEWAGKRNFKSKRTNSNRGRKICSEGVVHEILGYYLDTRGPLVSRLFLTFGTDVMGQSSAASPQAPCFIERSSLADCFAFVCTVQRLRHLSTLRRLGMGMHRVARVGGPNSQNRFAAPLHLSGEEGLFPTATDYQLLCKRKAKPKNKWN